MSEIFYAFIVVPIILIVVFGFIFQSSVIEIAEKQERLGCPYPAISGLWNDTSVVPSGVFNYTGARFNYNGNFGPSNTTLTLTCTNIHTADGIDYYYGASFASPAVVGWAYFVGDWLSELFANKVPALVELVYLFITAPAQISGLGWYSYVSAVLVTFIVFGGIMLARGT